MKGHITRKHQEFARNEIIKNYQHNAEDQEQEKKNEESTASKQLNDELSKINSILMPMRDAGPTQEEFDVEVDKIIEILKKSVDILPGTKHPAKKYYEIRKREEFKNVQKTFKYSSNPERSSKRKRDKKRAEYNYELMQYEYYNCRKKVVRNLMKKMSPKELCTISQEEIYEYFNSRWNIPNDKVLEDYGPPINMETQLLTMDEEYFD